MKAESRQSRPEIRKSRRVRLILARGRHLIMAGLIGIMTFSNSEALLASEKDPSPAIQVRVYNYSQASPAILAAAEHEASRILDKAGLRVAWLECPVTPVAVPQQEPCQRVLEGTDISLRVLATPIRNIFQDTAFGFAIYPVLASVYYEYALRRAKNDDAEFEIPIILGCVIAHELGHLLLGSGGHSHEGIMQARWESSQFRQLMIGTLLFKAEQSKAMQESARTRTEGQSRDPEITGAIYDDVQLPPKILADAEDEATRIFRKAGLKMLWAPCTLSKLPAEDDPRCHHLASAVHPSLRIVPHVSKSSEIFGVAFLSAEGTGGYSDVSYNAVEELNHNWHFGLARVLGTVMAHELGHLLLGSNAHSSIGIMQRHWGPGQVRQIMMGGLLFTEEQSRAMEESARNQTDPASQSPD